MATPNWTDIDRCPFFQTAGIIECATCDGKADCWPDVEMPEPRVFQVTSIRIPLVDLEDKEG